MHVVIGLFPDHAGLWSAWQGGRTHCEVRKHQPCINQNVSVPSADKHAVHANLSKSSYWQNAEGMTFIRGRSWKLPIFRLL